MTKRYIQCGAMHFRDMDEKPYMQNTGNILIGYGTNRFNNSNMYFNMWEELSEENILNIRENYDCILMGAANFLNPIWNFDICIKNFKLLKLPIVVFGLGAQCDNIKSSHISLSKSNIEFAKILSEYSVSLGVRGEFTAEVLNGIGIKNVQIIGCPSYYINGNKKFEIKKNKILNLNKDKVAMNYTDLVNDIDKKILRAAYRYNADIIGQMEYVEEAWSKNIPYDINNELLIQIAPVKENQYNQILNIGIHRVKKFMQGNFYQFYDVPKWIDHMKKYNFSIGTRIHGAMVAIQAGVPACIITHDSRTKELAEFCNIPYINKNDIKNDINIVKLYDSTDYSKLNSEYEKKYSDFKRFLVENNIDNVE